MAAYEGVVSVLKPPGLTSSDVVTDIRRIFSTRRVGHAGTLDPGAAGVLLICVGRATRLFDYLVDKEKEYIAQLTFGCATDTQDSYGQVIQRGERSVSAEALRGVLPLFCGDVEQVVPSYSALSQGGVKLYKLARQGKRIDEKRRTVAVSAIDYLAQTAPDRHMIRVSCSKGTYIRTLCHDIGHALGTCAHLSFLLRTRCGRFAVEDACTLEELRRLRDEGRLSEVVIPPDAAVEHIDRLDIGEGSRERRLFVNGAPQNSRARDGEYRVYCGGVFLGLGEVRDSKLSAKLMFADNDDDE